MIKYIDEHVGLNDGRQMPGYGFGCYKMHGAEVLTGVDAAVAYGYRYLDTASFYENEKEVGDAVRQCGIAREKLFVLSKIWPTEFANSSQAIDACLARLGFEYLDSCLLHWPGLDESLRYKAFEALLKAQQAGKVHVIGVSNFLQLHLENLHSQFQLWPAVNQIEIHPLFQQKQLCAFCNAHGIKVISWSPLGRGHELQLPELQKLAQATGKSVAQVILRWQVQKNYIPVPKSTHPQRIKENAQVFDFELTQEQMGLIDEMELPDNGGRTGKDPMSWPPM